MYGNGPSQSYGVLRIRAQFFFINRIFFFIVLITDVFPGFFFQFQFFTFAWKLYKYFVVLYAFDGADLAIVKTTGLAFVVFNKHDLCAFFQLQCLIYRESLVAEIAFYFAFKLVSSA